MKEMAHIDIILQSKGGAGKSFTASLLMQYYKHHDLEVTGFDTDPNNQTLLNYSSLDVKFVNILNGNEIEKRLFDPLNDMLLELPSEKRAVIDTGTGTYNPFCSYALDVDLFEAWTEQDGHEIVIHSILNGGQALSDTVNSMLSLIENFPNWPLCIWLNPKDGPVCFDNTSKFQDMPIYTNNKDKIRSIIELPDWDRTTFGRDIIDILVRKMTFDEAIKSSLPIMVRRRLLKYWNEVEELISQAIPL